MDIASIFTVYDEDARTFVISSGATDNSFIGTYPIEITLIDDEGETTTGTLSLKVIEIEDEVEVEAIEVEIEEGKEEEVEE